MMKYSNKKGGFAIGLVVLAIVAASLVGIIAVEKKILPSQKVEDNVVGSGGRVQTAATGITSLGGLTGSTQTFVDDTNVTVTSSGTTHTVGWTGTLADSRVANDITLTNITQVTNRAITDLSGTLVVGNGGTGQSSFGQGWLNSNGTTITASTSPTVNYIIATSTTEVSSFVAVKTGTKVNTDGATITVDWLQGPTQEVVLGATGRTLAFSNVQAGAALKLWVWQDGTGSRTITTYPTGTHWAGGSAPTLTATANKFDILVFTTASSTTQFSAGASLNY